MSFVLWTVKTKISVGKGSHVQLNIFGEDTVVVVVTISDDYNASLFSLFEGII